MVGKSRMRRAARLYWVKASTRRLRTLEAAASWVGDGGLSGSWRVRRSRWKFGRKRRMPCSKAVRFS